MKYLWILMLTALACGLAQNSFAQNESNVIKFQSASPVVVGAMSTFDRALDTPVQGSPYSATVTNESIQALADGNRIVQKSTGTIARDSLGRTRQDTALPAIGNLSAANAPHIVFIQDPVGQTSYTLDVTDKTAQKMPNLSAIASGPPLPGAAGAFFIQSGSVATLSAAPSMPPVPPSVMSTAGIAVQRGFVTSEQAQATTEDLGSQTIEGVLVTGVRTTRTIPAGQIGNEKPISIVTEVWTSPDLKTIVSSKRTDPRMGEQTFQLTNIVRSEPDPSLFTVPADFKTLDGPQNFLYRTNQ